MSALPQDFRVAVRQLSAHPGLVLIVVVTLALGIGATTTCFAVLNGVAFKPLPFADPDRLIAFNLADRQTARWSRPLVDTFTALQQVKGAWSAAGAYRHRPRLRRTGRALRIVFRRLKSRTSSLPCWVSR